MRMTLFRLLLVPKCSGDQLALNDGGEWSAHCEIPKDITRTTAPTIGMSQEPKCAKVANRQE
jgi:hypothetical protein